VALQPDQTLSHYRLVRKIGEGGMGVVWEALDTKLDRRVAIKILPEKIAGDEGRVARFRREAKLLASLNHPNIAAIHGLEESGGVHFLVLELVPGENLAQILGRGPLPIDEALEICRQIAAGLDAAHGSAVIHRDLKPGNVKVTPDGKVKVLDFGLAKAFDPASSDSSGSDVSQSPTLTPGGTREGVILGTAPYMSPEQARGKGIDKRTDIWAFGCVLYECLTGRRAFPGETATDTLSAILSSEPDWSALPERIPPRVRDLLERSLEKSLQRRLRDIGDAWVEIDRALARREWATAGIGAVGGVPAAHRLSWRGWTLLTIVSLIVVGVVGKWWEERPSGPERSAASLSILTAPGRYLQTPFPMISPDGEWIAYAAMDEAGEDSRRVVGLYTRRLDGYEETLVEGSEGAIGAAFSPDGRWLAFVAPLPFQPAQRRLMKVPVDGSAPPVTLADWPEEMGPEFPAAACVWLPSGDIAGVTLRPWSIVRFPTDGSPPKPPVPVRADAYDNRLILHSALPDGRNVLAAGSSYGGPGWQFNVLVLDTETGETRLLVEDGTTAVLSPTGHLLFTRDDKLLAVSFDTDRLEVTGGAVAITDELAPSRQGFDGWFSISSGGTLVYVPGGTGAQDRRLALVDRDGRISPWSDDRQYFLEPVVLSPDDRLLALASGNVEEGVYEMWVSEVDRPRLRPVVDVPAMDCHSPVWSPGADRLFYQCRGKGDTGGIYRRRVDGTDEPELLLERGSPDVFLFPTSISPDGSALLITRQAGAEFDVLLLTLGTDRNGRPAPVVLVTGITPWQGAYFSPDGRWIAYASEETGRSEIYIRGIDGEGRLGSRIRVSTGGGVWPRWSRSARGEDLELLYESPSDHLMAVRITTRPAVAISEAREVLDRAELGILGSDSLPDGRFLVIQKGEGERELRQINVVVNFQEEVRRRVSAGSGSSR
jgi:serine/threonine-protein kinase